MSFSVVNIWFALFLFVSLPSLSAQARYCFGERQICLERQPDTRFPWRCYEMSTCFKREATNKKCIFIIGLWAGLTGLAELSAQAFWRRTCKATHAMGVFVLEGLPYTSWNKWGIFLIQSTEIGWFCLILPVETMNPW